MNLMPPPPSRADEVDNWASMKKPISNLDSSTGGVRSGGGGGSAGGGGFAYGQLGGGSRADEVDNWNFGKKPQVQVQSQGVGGGGRSSTFGSGFKGDSGPDWRRGGVEMGRPRLMLDPPSVRNGEKDNNVEVKSKPNVNPFGDAKPREVLLEEKGLDWRKMDLDLEHRRINRPETEEETALKEEIENLKSELEKVSVNNVTQDSEGEQVNLPYLIQNKERELEALTKDLNDKVGQNVVERPNSRPGFSAGRFTSFSDRPPSQSGSFDDVRGPEVMDRPRSRGTGDVWTRPPGEDRRGGFQGGSDRGGFWGNRERGGLQGNTERGGFQGGRDREGFLGNREFDRYRSRERW